MSTSKEARRRAAVADGLVIVGLVGRTGSGKSTVARTLAETGAVVIEGDSLGHEVTDHDPEVRRALVAEYGEEVYAQDGTLDRQAVANRVFRDPEARQRLDRLVHPRIIELIRRRLERLRVEGFRGVVVIDAALLLDWGLEAWCDHVIAVVAPEADQVARLIEGRRWSREEARRRLGVQRSNEAFAAAADLTLKNHGSRADLDRETRKGIAAMLERRAGQAGTTGGERC
jgi:dephospho-CoA kinase